MSEHAENQHLCCITENDLQFVGLVSEFLVAGVLAHEKIVYLVEHESKTDQILDEMREAFEDLQGPTIHHLVNSGQIVFLPDDQYYTIDNCFDPERCINQLKKTRLRALAEGYRGLRVVGSPTWVLSMEQDQPGTWAKFIEYESKLNYFFAECKDCHAWCQYSQDVFAPSTLVEVIKCHSRVAMGGELYDNFYYIPPTEFLDSANASSTTLKHWMKNLKEKKRTGRRLQSANQQLQRSNQTLQREMEIRIQAEKEKAHAEELNRAKSLFMATISHEIRTPLTGIIGSASLLLESDGLSDAHRDSIATIENSGDHLLAVINDVLTFSKLESDRLNLVNEPFSLQECCRGVQDMFAAQAKSRTMKSACVFTPDCPNIIAGDPTRFRQVLFNLVSNAFKFTPDGGEITSLISTRPPRNQDATTSKSQREIELVVQVCDTGIGVPKGKYDLIFEPFTQIDSSLERKYEGTGLGLSISKKLVEAWNGRIWVESEEGQGSRFFFTLPTHTRERRGLPNRESRATSTNVGDRNTSSMERLCVMVADDNAINRKVLCKMLEKLGHPPSAVVVDGVEAVEEVQRRRESNRRQFDLILLDIHMPNMSGLEACRLIGRMGWDAPEVGGASNKSVRTHYGPKPILACVLSEDKEECKRAGFLYHVSKPLKLANLESLIEELASNGREVFRR